MVFFKAYPEIESVKLCFKGCKEVKETKHLSGLVVSHTVKVAWLCSECGEVIVEDDASGPLDDIVEKLDRILTHFGLSRY